MRVIASGEIAYTVMADHHNNLRAFDDRIDAPTIWPDHDPGIARHARHATPPEAPVGRRLDRRPVHGRS
jgi:hypothetical protein